MVDTGCSRTIVSKEFGKGGMEQRRSVDVVMMNGEVEVVNEVRGVCLEVGGRRFVLDCLMGKVLGPYQILLGMDVIAKMGGIKVDREGGVKFGEGIVAAASSREDKIVIEDKDFVAKFEDGHWTVSWVWKNGEEPELTNKLAGYKVNERIRPDYEREIRRWIEEGWLQPYDGPTGGLLPLLAVLQENKGKVRPVMDFRELNQFVSSHTGESAVCGEKLREWRRKGTAVTMVDLKNAYLQIRVDKSMWRYQVVEFGGRKYCLTRLGFGLNAAPKIMSAILRKVLSMDRKVDEATDSYIDDIIVDESKVCARSVAQHLRKFGLESKEPEALDGCRVLGLNVTKEKGVYVWRRSNILPVVSNEMTKREVFSICGKLVGHYPICGWLRVACSYVKRQIDVGGWNQEVGPKVRMLVTNILERIGNDDPVKGQWDVPGDRSGTVWCDASSLATAAVLEIGGRIVEDAAWLRKKDESGHINLSELEAVLKGINLSLAWGLKDLVICCDSQTVCGWLQAIIGNDSKVRTHGLSESLVRRRLGIVKDTITEYGLEVEIRYVPSKLNKADVLTRVPKDWMRPAAETKELAAAVNLNEESAIRQIHEMHHFGVNRTAFFVRKKFPQIEDPLGKTREVIRQCEKCASIDPAPVRWERGSLDVKSCWARLAIDVTHYGGKHFLSVIDCGPSRFTIWRPLKSETTEDILPHLESVFSEFGPPKSILLDNAAVFRSVSFRQFCGSWSVSLEFRCADRPAGNGIVERVHRTVKRMAARVNGTPQRMCFWLNSAPKNALVGQSAPAAQLFRREWWCPGVDDMSPKERMTTDNRFSVGQKVFVKPGEARCTQKWRTGQVTEIGPGTQIQVEGIPRHVADVRAAPNDERSINPEGREERDAAPNDERSIDPEGREERNAGEPRYPSRERRAPDRLLL